MNPHFFNGRGYQFAIHYFRRTWAQARQFCVRWGGDLVHPHTIRQWATVMRIVRHKTRQNFWTGANDLKKEGKWTFSNGSKFWHPRNSKQPRKGTEDCGESNVEGKWSQTKCGKKRQFVCQRQATKATFKYFHVKMNWPDAQRTCKRHGMHLASIRNRAEADYVRKLVHTKSPVWIGANDLLKEGKFMWTDGTLLNWTNWHKNEPNNYGNREDCGAIWNGYKWNDWFCSSKAFFLCERRLSTLQLEAAQRRREAHQRRMAALHLIHARRAAIRRLVYLKGKKAYEMRRALELRYKKRAIALAHHWMKLRMRALRKARYEAKLKIKAEIQAKLWHQRRVMWQRREKLAHIRKHVAIKTFMVQQAIARKALARARFERIRKHKEIRRAHYAKIARIAAMRSAAHAIKLRNHFLKLAHIQMLKEMKMIKWAKIEARRTVLIVLRSKEAIRKSKVTMRMYYAKMRVQHKLRKRADQHTAVSMRAIARMKIAYILALKKTRAAKVRAYQYKRSYHVYKHKMIHERRVAAVFFRRAAGARRRTKVALHHAKIYRKRAAHMLAKMNHYKLLYFAARKSTQVHIRMFNKWNRLSLKFRRARAVLMVRWRHLNHQRIVFRRKAVVFRRAAMHITKQISIWRIRHTKMVRHWKLVITKLRIQHALALRRIHKWGKARLHAITVRIARMTAAHIVLVAKFRK